MIGTINNITKDYKDNKIIISIKLDSTSELANIEKLAEDKLDIEIKKYRAKRSLNANSYFHLLCNKIATKMNLGEEETKVRLVLEYGAIMRDENNEVVGFKLPVSVNVNSIYKYAKWFDKRLENGKEFNCYIIYQHTHLYDTKEMSRLLEGTVKEAKELNIETLDDIELKRMCEQWNN